MQHSKIINITRGYNAHKHIHGNSMIMVNSKHATNNHHGRDTKAKQVLEPCQSFTIMHMGVVAFLSPRECEDTPGFKHKETPVKIY